MLKYALQIRLLANMAATFETVDKQGIRKKSASIRGATRKRSGPIPIASMASTSSETCIVPSSAVKAAPMRAAIMMPVRSDAGLRRSRGHRGNGDRTAAFPSRSANAGTFFSDALFVHSFKCRRHICEQPDLQSVFQHRLPLFSRPGERRFAHSRHHHRNFEEFSVWSADRRDRLLSGAYR